MSQLDAFEDCAFGICDFVESAFNQNEDTQIKLAVDQNGLFDESSILLTLRSSEQFINDKIASLELKLVDLSIKISKEDIMGDNL